MIRINLLATERKVEKKRSAAAPGAVQLYLFMGLFAGGALLVCAGLWWMKSAAIAELGQQIQVAEKRQKELEVIKKQVEEFERKKALLDEQIKLIDTLKLRQADAVHMMDEISKALPDFVWIEQVNQAGANVRFTGKSNSLTAVASFIENLEKSGWFAQPVNLVSSQETNNVITFQLAASFVNPEVAQKEKEAAAAAAASRPAPPPRKS